MTSIGGFKASENKQKFDALPPGSYRVMITKESVSQINQGKGRCLTLEFTVVEGVAKGRKVWMRYNWINPTSPQNEQIAKAQLAEVCEAVGVEELNDTDQLHHKQLMITTKVRPESEDYPAQAEVKRAKKLQNVEAAPPEYQVPTVPEGDVQEVDESEIPF